MRKFNPEKELRKIQKGNKNKVILFVISLLVVGVIGYSFALYQIRYNKQIIYTKVAPFYSKDLQLAVYVNGVKQDKFPDKSEEMLYGGYECENDSEITFDRNEWMITLKTNHPDKCSLRFGTKYEDESGANYPELYQGMIPVYFKEGKIYIADITSEWYNYDNNEWANAVLIDYGNKKDKFYDDNGNLLGGHEVKEEDILQMYVWIPRYKYQLFNAENGSIEPTEIKIEFENNVETTGEVTCTIDDKGTETCSEVANKKWYTHPAFTFGETELPGIWIGKFETSHTTKSINVEYSSDIDTLNCEDNSCDEANNIRIIPNVASLRYNTISQLFYVSRSIEKTNNLYNLDSKEIDTHLVKNIEWGATAYLTQSKYGRCDGNGNCVEVTPNSKIIGSGSTRLFKTGYDDKNNLWNTEKGTRASTTGNIYGVYDMSGGSWEYVMGVLVNSGGEIYYGESGYSNMNQVPSKKYYDIYSETIGRYENGHLGDATRETLTSSLPWYNDFTSDHSPKVPWLVRSHYAGGASASGIFGSKGWYGGYHPEVSSRIVLTQQDGNE